MELKTWLKKIPDSTMLRKLTIIGTNDSCSYKYSNPFLKYFYRTQDKCIKEQLEMGIRYLDITLTRKGDNCHIKSGRDCICIDKHLLSVCHAFLNENPSEFIMINIRADYVATKVFMKKYASKIDTSEKYVMTTDSNTTVGDIRGKILFMNIINSNEYIENIRCRVNYNDNYPSSDSGCIKKYADIISFDLDTQEDDNRLYVNYTNTRGYKLKFIPHPKTSALVINKMIKDCFSNLKMREVVLVVDFIDKELAKTILINNF